MLKHIHQKFLIISPEWFKNFFKFLAAIVNCMVTMPHITQQAVIYVGHQHASLLCFASYAVALCACGKFMSVRRLSMLNYG